MKKEMLIVTAFVLCMYVSVEASRGDRSRVYNTCLYHCKVGNCSISDATFMEKQTWDKRLFRWGCVDECRYICMWVTVDAFEKDRSPVPQFHGKWPFERLGGIQEPASALFSIMNGIPHIVMMFKFRKVVPARAPLYWIWHFYALVAVNAWTWSTVFHSRDTNFTEKMDYFCAISMMLANLFACVCRVVGTRILWRPFAAFGALLAFFVYHVHYLAFVHFDYSYNMQANVAVGLTNSIMWIAWCYRVRKQQPYVWRCLLVILSVDVLLCFELWDFPPIWWTFDAHSLWHGGTTPLSWIWYRFVIDDCLYMIKQEDIGKAKKNDDLVTEAGEEIGEESKKDS